jgi:hypothetical protein
MSKNATNGKAGALVASWFAAFVLTVIILYGMSFGDPPARETPDSPTTTGRAAVSPRDTFVRKVAARIKANVADIASIPARGFFVRNPLVIDYLTNREGGEFHGKGGPKRMGEFREEWLSGKRLETSLMLRRRDKIT